MGPLYRVQDDKITFAAGLVAGVACAPRSMPKAEVERRVRLLDVPGTSSGWSVEGRAQVCADDPERKHWRVAC